MRFRTRGRPDDVPGYLLVVRLPFCPCFLDHEPFDPSVINSLDLKDVPVHIDLIAHCRNSAEATEDQSADRLDVVALESSSRAVFESAESVSVSLARHCPLVEGRDS